MIPEIIRGETNASGARRRICRSTLPSRLAISAKEAARPSMISSIQLRAFAIAASNTSRPSELIVGHGDGEWRMPLAAAGIIAEKGTVMVMAEWPTICATDVFSVFRTVAVPSKTHFDRLTFDDDTSNVALDKIAIIRRYRTVTIGVGSKTLAQHLNYSVFDVGCGHPGHATGLSGSLLQGRV